MAQSAPAGKPQGPLVIHRTDGDKDYNPAMAGGKGLGYEYLASDSAIAMQKLKKERDLLAERVQLLEEQVRQLKADLEKAKK